MICPYCECQNPDDAVVCSSCNAVLKKGAQPPASAVVDGNPAVANPNGSEGAPSPSVTVGTPMGANPAETPPAGMSGASAYPAGMQPTGMPPTGTPQAGTYPGGMPAAGTYPSGAPTAGAPSATMPPAGMPPAGTTPAIAPAPAKAPNGKRSKTILLIVLGAVALVAIIIAIVAFVTCSANGGKSNMNRLITDEPEKVAKSIENLDIVKLYTNAYYTPEDMTDTIRKANDAFANGSRGDIKKAAADIEELKPWAISLYEEEKSGKDGYRDFKNLKLVNIENGDDPGMAICLTYRVLDDPTPEDILKIVQEYTTVDEITFGTDPTREAERFYDENVYYVGAGKGPDTVVRVRVDKLDDVYEVMIHVFNTNELEAEKIKVVDNFNDNFDKHFDNKVTLPKKN